MKWVYLLGVMMLAPALAALLQSNRRYLVPTCFILGVSMMMLGPSLWAAPIGWPTWPASVKGTVISFVDAVSVALLFSTRKVRVPMSLKLSYAIICIALLVSTMVAYNPIAAFFYIWQFLRSTLLFLAIARVCSTEPRAIHALVAGLGAGMIGEAVWVAVQYAQHVHRPGGSFGYSNFLGLVSDLVVSPVLALLLGGRGRLWPAATVAAGFICAVLGASRAAIGLFAAGVLLTVFLSIMHKRSSRKFAFAGAMGLLLLVTAPVMVWATGQRDKEDVSSSDAQRAAMNEAAKMIIADHPFGVGANQYVIIANVGGYSARAGVGWNEGTRRAPVHNTYYLVTAELGFIGLIGLFALLGSFIMLGIKTLRRHLPDESGELVPGLLAAMIILAVHMSYEFALFDFVVHYLFAMAGGILVAISARAKAPARTASIVPVGPGALSHAN